MLLRPKTKHLLPFPTPTDTPNTNTNTSDDDQVILVYPPKDETISVIITQNNPSTKLNCTVLGSNLTGIEMLWTHNGNVLMNDFIESLNGKKVSYVLANEPGVYKCIVQSTGGMMDSEIAGVFELSMPGKMSNCNALSSILRHPFVIKRIHYSKVLTKEESSFNH